MLRRCAICDIESDESHFQPDENQVDGLSVRCAQCMGKTRRAVNRERAEQELAPKSKPKPKPRPKPTIPHKWPNKAPSIQRRARHAVETALKSGRIHKKPCVCGSTKVQGHHTDYTKPLDVTWLCEVCHNRIHTHKH